MPTKKPLANNFNLILTGTLTFVFKSSTIIETLDLNIP